MIGKDVMNKEKTHHLPEEEDIALLRRHLYASAYQ